MNHDQRGIILKRFQPSEHTFSVLTSTDGKIALVVLDHKMTRRLHPGCVIDFTIHDRSRDRCLAEQVAVMMMPIMSNFTDTVWLHHLLELCYYFLPVGQAAGDMYDFLLRNLILLFNHECDAAVWDASKMMSIGVFCMHLGFLPPESLRASINDHHRALLSCVDFTAVPSVQFCNTHLIDLSERFFQILEDWLLGCIQSHPRAEMFKTVRFMYSVPTEVR